MENYEKKYKEAFERAVKIYNEHKAQPFNVMLKVFPELAESEDEKIRKALIFHYQGDGCLCTNEYRIDYKDILTWLEKQVAQKPTDKVKPKFHEGDWVVFNGLILHIDEIVDGYYRTTSIDGIPNSYDLNIDNAARLWTIQDAKPGDVLVCPPLKGCECGEQIFMFKSINNRDYVDDCIEYYCRVCEGVFYENKNCYMGTTSEPIYPATKEQRDLLFIKMKEAGYEWDVDKNELRKIEQKPKYNDDIKYEIIEFICSRGGFKQEYLNYIENTCNKNKLIKDICKWLKTYANSYVNGEYNWHHKCYEYDGTVDTDKMIKALKNRFEK